MTISAAGFGRQISWEDNEAPDGHKLTFKHCVEIVGTGIFIRVLCPGWFFDWAPFEKIREARDGFAEFRVREHEVVPGCILMSSDSSVTLIWYMQAYLTEMINERKLANEKGEKRDLFSNLIKANEELLDDGKRILGEEELIGASPCL